MSRSAATVLALLAALVAAPAATASAAEPPPPPGANVACKPSAAKPNPVVLVHGTFENRMNNWLAMSPALKAAGYCVYALNYGGSGGEALGVYGTGKIERSAGQLRDFVNRVRAQTGAAKVDLVGHSQGGMMPRYYIKNLGGARFVDDLVGISPSNQGTANPIGPVTGVFCPACAQQLVGSPFITALNTPDDSPGDVSYTNVVTRYDEVVVPFTNGYLKPAGNVTNLTLQDKCPTDTSEHVRTPYSAGVIGITKHALARRGPADPGFQPACAPL